MDELTLDKFDPVIKFLKQNILITAIFLIGFALLLIGLIQILSPKQNDIAFIKDSENQKESQKKQIAIDIEGAVVSPGVYMLGADSRVQDALIAAGGLSAEADRQIISKRINLAQKITDGQKLYIPKIGESKDQAAAASGGVADVQSGNGLVLINSASLSELDTLPGVGKVTAQKIVDNRPYATIEELLSKKIMSQKVFEQNKDRIDL